MVGRAATKLVHPSSFPKNKLLFCCIVPQTRYRMVSDNTGVKTAAAQDGWTCRPDHQLGEGEGTLHDTQMLTLRPNKYKQNIQLKIVHTQVRPSPALMAAEEELTNLPHQARVYWKVACLLRRHVARLLKRKLRSADIRRRPQWQKYWHEQ